MLPALDEELDKRLQRLQPIDDHVVVLQGLQDFLRPFNEPRLDDATLEAYLDFYEDRLKPDREQIVRELMDERQQREQEMDEMEDYTLTTVIVEETPGRPDRQILSAKVEKMKQTRDEQRQFMDQQVAIHATDFPLDDEHGVRLEGRDLVRAGLSPRHKITFGGEEILVSDAYDVEGRIAFVGYVKDKEITDRDVYVARTYYRSRSASAWRYLPSYMASGSDVRWFDKGWDEQSVTTPIPMQFALNQVLLEQANPNTPRVLTAGQNPYFYFAGTARNFGTRNTFQTEVESIPVDLGSAVLKLPPGERRVNDRLVLAPPESLRLDHVDKPNFSEVILTSESDTELEGHVTYEIFLSQDGRKAYMMKQYEKDGQMCASLVMGEDLESPMAKDLGVKARWIDLGDLAMPSSEYDSQAGAYGGAVVKRPYVDMWPNYISKIPLVQEYLTSVAQRNQPTTQAA